MTKLRKAKRKNGSLSVLLIVLVILAAMIFSIYRLKIKDAEYREKENAAQQAYEAETERAVSIDELSNYMKTTQFIEDMAKSKLGLAYDNEIIFKERDGK